MPLGEYCKFAARDPCRPVEGVDGLHGAVDFQPPTQIECGAQGSGQ
jgi:hypothetical protein